MENFIGLHFGNYRIKVINAREVMGHDDSFPYNAEWEIYLCDNLIAIGTAWNDGWGGESYFDTTCKQYIIDNVSSEIKERFVGHYQGLTLNYSFMDVIDDLALLYVDGNNGYFSEKAYQKYINE